MAVQHPGGDPNAHLYEQFKRDVLDRVPQIVAVGFVPNRAQARSLQATFGPARLDPPTGPDPPKLEVTWYRQTPHDWFRVDYHDPNTDFHAGWHQDEDHPDLGPVHFQYATTDDQDKWGVSFGKNTPSLILWEIMEELLEAILPRYTDPQ